MHLQLTFFVSLNLNHKENSQVFFCVCCSFSVYFVSVFLKRYKIEVCVAAEILYMNSVVDNVDYSSAPERAIIAGCVTHTEQRLKKNMAASILM